MFNELGVKSYLHSRYILTNNLNLNYLRFILIIYYSYNIDIFIHKKSIIFKNIINIDNTSHRDYSNNCTL